MLQQKLFQKKPENFASKAQILLNEERQGKSYVIYMEQI